MHSGLLPFLIFFFFALFNFSAFSQELTQTIRGSVKDVESKFPLPGATVAVYDDTLLVKGVATDESGNYKAENIPLGRYTLVIHFLGYRQTAVPNVIVNSGRETIVHIELETSTMDMDEVTITARDQRGIALNEMTSLSARIFAVEESERYAGSRGDPARMAANFAGVVGGNDNSNDIVVRGNSPLGLLWRLEGVNIPNPNHFGVTGNTGGPVTILNNKLLANSDFITGAFPAEYGNTVAGVFDLRMRNGNNQKHEFSGQFGFLGTEIMAEGPFNGNKNSSYLLNYRYSTLAIFQALNINIGTDAVPQYQDLSFKLNFPMENNSNFSLFGIGGLSGIDILKSKQTDTSKIDIFGNDNTDERFRSGMGVMGMNFARSPNINTYFRFTLSSSIEHQSNVLEDIYRRIEGGEYVVDSLTLTNAYDFYQWKHSAAFFVNKRIHSRHTIKTGVYNDLHTYNLTDSVLNQSLNAFKIRLDDAGYFLLTQPYIQWQFRALENFTINSGLHGQYLSLNSSYSIEPRAGMRWQFKPSQSLNFGVGMHSQMLPAYIYAARNADEQGNLVQINKDVDFLRSVHFVAGYDNWLSRYLRLRVETYYQHLYNVPVETKESAYSLLNQGDDLNRFFPDELVNEGKGKNYGIEMTLEKFFSSKYYFMLTASLFDSKYTGSDGSEYNTVFNSNYVVNLIGGKEFNWGARSRSGFGVGGAITFAGGKRYTPIHIDASEIVGYAVFIDSLTNSKQFRDYFRADIKLNYKLNTKRVTHELGLDLVNVFDNKNIFKLSYTGGIPPVREEYQLGFLPIFYYRVDF